MFAKRQQYKSKITNFSSEDSQNTDHSMNSSLEIAETNAQHKSSNKFNQLRETMNQMFLANPELAEEIKFEQYHIDEEIEVESPKLLSNPTSQTQTNQSALPLINLKDPIQQPPQVEQSSSTSSKFWGAISKEMTKPQKNSKAPSLNQINHILNIFKMKFEKPEAPEASLSPSKTNLNVQKGKNDFRIQSAKFKGEKKFGLKLKDGKNGFTSPTSSNVSAMEEEGEDGVSYFSSRKKTHLKLKQKRIQRELEEQARKKELDAEREKLAKEREQKQMMSTLAELDEEIMKNKVNNLDVDESGEGTSRNTTKLKGRISNNFRSNSIKKGDIFERLTKDFNRKPTTEDEEEVLTKRTFISPFAESLYKDMKAFGDPEAFKKIAQARIMNYKKEFKEKLAKQKQLPVEGLKFSKESTRHLNMFVPDFEKTLPVPNKENIFVMNDIHRDSEEWRENPEYEILTKFQKMKQGNLMEFWKETKDLDQ